MAYSTALQVKDKDIVRFTDQAGWDDSDIEARIEEADRYVDACLAKLGFVVPFIDVPPLVNTLSTLYARYATIRDLFPAFGQNKDVEQGERYKKPFDSLIADLKDGKISIVDDSGNVLDPARVSNRILTNVDDVHRANTMGDPTRNFIDEKYDDQAVTGDPTDRRNEETC